MQLDSVANDHIPPKFWHKIRFTPIEKTVTKLLVAAHPEDVKVTKIIHELYADKINGGPLGADKVLHNRVCYLRRKLIGTGWKIINEYGSYKLAREVSEQSNAA